MPVDPAINEILEQILPFMPDNWDDVDPKEFRDEARARNQFMKFEVPAGKVEDFDIAVKGGVIKGRLYSPVNCTDALVIYFHGGGFVIGDIESADGVCRIVSNEGNVKVLSVDYRLAPESKFPTAVEDAYEAYKWANDNAGRLGINRARIAVMGDSAGGNLCATMSIQCIEDNYQVPALSVMFYPVVAPDFSSISLREYSNGLLLSEGIMKWFHRQYMDRDSDLLSPYMYPILYSRISEMPESIIITAEYDVLRDQGETFASLLKRNSVEATGIRALGMIHGFLGYVKFSTAAKNVLDMVAFATGQKLRMIPPM